MNWEDECYLLTKRKFRENANIINVFTLNKGVVGVLFMVEIHEKLEIIYRYQIKFLLFTILKMIIKLVTLRLS